LFEITTLIFTCAYTLTSNKSVAYCRKWCPLERSFFKKTIKHK